MKRRFMLVVTLLVAAFLLSGVTGCPFIDDMDRSDPPQGQNISFESQSQANKKLHLKQGAAAFFKNLPQDDYLITAAGLKKLMDNQPELVQIIDIRKPADFAKNHIQGALNIPFEDIGGQMNKLVEGKQIIVVCETGQAAAMATAALNMADFQCKSLRDGFPAWQQAGYESVNGQASQQNTRQAGL